jgi:hypothetical protein
MLLRLACLTAAVLVTQAPAFEGTLRLRTIEVTLEEDGLKESWLTVAPAALAAREDASVDSSGVQIKGTVMRLANKEGGEGYALLDFGRHVMVMVDPASRAYIEMPLPAGAPPQAATAPGRQLVKPLGQTRKINGINVTGYEVRSSDQIIRAWMTQDFPGLTGTFRTAAAQMGDHDEDDPDDAAMSQLMRHGFPVLMITLTDRSLRIEETVSIERAALSADLFKVPAGFTRQTLPGGP